MELRRLKTFIRVADAGTFSKAEEMTYTSRQALKKQVDAVERDMNIKLMTRSSKGIELTPAGKEFYGGVMKILASWEELGERCHAIANNENVITIANPSNPRLVLEPVYLEFSERYPNIKQDFVFISKDEIVSAVLSGAVDVAEVVLQPGMELNNVNYMKLRDMQYCCIMAHTHPLAKREKICIGDLSGFFVGLRGHGNYDLIQKLKGECNDIQLVETMGSHMKNMFQFCYNHGIYISRNDYQSQTHPLVSVPLDTDIRAECGILYSKNCSPIVGNFLDVVKEIFCLM